MSVIIQQIKKKKSVFSANFLLFTVVMHCGFGQGSFFCLFCFYIKLLLDLDIHALIFQFIFFECNNKATVKKTIEILHMCKGT